MKFWRRKTLRLESRKSRMSCVNDEHGEGGGAEGNMIQKIHVRLGSNYAQKNEWIGEAKTQEKETVRQHRR